MLKTCKGFSIIEIVVATFILFLVVIGASKLISSFGIFNKKRLTFSCLVNAASSVINACKAGVVVNSVNCGGMSIKVSLTGSCSPSPGTCSLVTAKASYGEHEFSLSDSICNFD